MAEETPKKQPTASEAMFFYAIVKHTKNKADIDWSAVAAEQNFKSAEVAKVRFGQVKRKLGIDTAVTPASSGKGSAKKTGGSESNSTGAGGSVLTTPTKVTKRTGRTGGRGKKTPVKKEEDTDPMNQDQAPEEVKPSVEEEATNATKSELQSEPQPEMGGGYTNMEHLLNF